MEHIVIQGGRSLQGQIPIAGAKNAALKELAACLLCPEPVQLSNVPHLDDTTLMVQLLMDLGCQVTCRDGGVMDIDAKQVTQTEVPYSLVRAMRASIVVLGPLLARFKEAKVALPGGCAIGPRPIDIHLDGLRAMGAEIEVQEGFVCAKAKKGLKGAHISMRQVSVTATENLMMAATLASGVTTLENAACEPEVQDLAHMLNAMGANISGIGTHTITIKGVKKLHGVMHKVIPDRIEAGTYLVAAAMTEGHVTALDVPEVGMEPIMQKLIEAGASCAYHGNNITVDMRGKMLRAIMIETAPHPGFPTDMQAQFMALNTIAAGVGMVRETVFENRFMHVAELQRLGANIRVKGDMVTTAGVHRLVGAPVNATDLRASACLVLAGLVAEGTTTIEGVQHMDRGYAFLEEKLRRLGADICRCMG